MAYTLTTRKTWAQCVQDLRNEFRLWSITDWQIDPVPEGTRADPAFARRVVLRFSLRGQEIVWTQEAQNRRVDNLRVLFLIVESMRLNELRGLGTAMREAYLSLPPPKDEGEGFTARETPKSPYDVLGVGVNAPMEVIEAAYRQLAKSAHPDAGGSTAQMAVLNEAISVLRERSGQ